MPSGIPILNVTDPQFSPARTDTGISISAGSALVLDPSITASDSGSLASHYAFAHFQFPVYVSSVIAGTSFIASSSPTASIPVPASCSCRTDTVTISNSTSTVIDASILLADLGQPVYAPVSGSGTLIGYVGTITAGTSFVLSSSPNTTTAVNPPSGVASPIIVGRTPGNTSIGIGSGGTCTYNDTCIQNAINALPATGGQVYLPAGQANFFGTNFGYYTSNPIVIGNGTSVACLVTSGSTAGGATNWGSNRTDSVTYSNSSSTIHDAAILATDIGAPVSGINIPVPAYVGTIVPGTSFTLSSSPTNPSAAINPTGSGTSLTVTPMFVAATSARANGFAAGQRESTTGSVVASSAALTDSSASFDATIIGQPITIYGAGPSGGTLVTSIQAVNSATSLTLATNASTSISGTARYHYGPNTIATLLLSMSNIIAVAITYTYVDSAGFHGCSYSGGGSTAGYGPTVGYSIGQGTTSTKVGVVVEGIPSTNGPATSGVYPLLGTVIYYLGGDLIANSVSGGAIMDVVGPINGWSIKDLVVNGDFLSGGCNASGHGIRVTNGSYGWMQNVSVNSCAGSQIMARCWPWMPICPLVGTFMNMYKQIQVETSAVSGSIGINIGGTETTSGPQSGGNDTFMDTWEMVYAFAQDPGVSAGTYCVRFGQCDDNTMRSLYTSGGPHTYSVIYDYAGNNFGGNGTFSTCPIPFGNLIDGFLPSNPAPVSGGVLASGVNLGSAPTSGFWNRIMNTPSIPAGVTPSYENLVYGNNATFPGSLSTPFHSHTFTSGVGSQCTSTSISTDNIAYVTVNLAGTLTISLGPTSAATAVTILNAASVVAGQLITVRIPAQYYMKITAVTARYTAELQALA